MHIVKLLPSRRTAVLLGIAVICLTIIILNFKRPSIGSNLSLRDINKTIKTSVGSELNKPICIHGAPCEYPETVDFRIIVLTYKRSVSLQKLLNTVDTVVLDGDTGRLEIWIDRSKDGTVDEATLKVAKEFNWKHGPTRVHVQTKHAGIYGQWIDTWTPSSSPGMDRELALILEDDISLSPFAYRWIKAVHRHYGKVYDFAGSSLTSDELKCHDGSYAGLAAPSNHTVFMYKIIGTWGFSPSPQRWRDFQQWYHRHIKEPDFHPYVPGTITTSWYKSFENGGTSDSMWEQWFIYFAHKEKLFTLYNNLKVYNKNSESCLCINRREVGLHVGSKGREDLCKLLTTWNDTFVHFPNKTLKLDFNAKPVNGY